MKLARDAKELIDNTIANDELTKLQIRKEKLETELMTVVKSTGVSVDFLTKELASKEADVKANLSKLNKCDTKLQSLQNKYNLYMQDHILKFSQSFPYAAPPSILFGKSAPRS